MDRSVCPGARFLRQPRPEIFSCPDCGEEVEIWSDEIRGTCGACGKNVFREGLPSCVEWCKYGEECVGEEAFGTYQRNRALGIKLRLLQALERLGLLEPTDVEIRRCAAGWAEALLEREAGDWHLVIPAVLVHHVAFPGASGQGSLERVLLAQGLDPDDVQAVRSILEELTARGGPPRGPNARIVADGWALAELEQEKTGAVGDRPASEARHRLSTVSAKTLARERLAAATGLRKKGAAAAGRSRPGMTEEADA